MIENNRDIYIDVVKGIGIFSIVIGHASWDISMGDRVLHIGQFVYLYHLAIFAFCSGYLFKDPSDFWGYLGKKLKNFYRPFMVYSLLYLVTRNFLIDLFIVDGTKYTLDQNIIIFANLLAFNSLGEMLSAFWFIPMLFFALGIFCAIHIWTKNIRNSFVHKCTKIILFLGFGILGIYCMEHKMGLLCNLQVSFLFIPIMAIGYYLRKFNWLRIVNSLGLIISFGIMVLLIYKKNVMIELSRYQIGGKWIYYPVTALGIYFCLALSKMVLENKKVGAVFAKMGRYSFDIMALHFFAFKIVDQVACRVINDREKLNLFPHSYVALWPIYYVVGIALPILCKWMFENIKNSCSIKSKI